MRRHPAEKNATPPASPHTYTHEIHDAFASTLLLLARNSYTDHRSRVSSIHDFVYSLDSELAEGIDFLATHIQKHLYDKN